MAKKLYIKTYGCQMNVYDSARMADVLAPVGYAPFDQADGADMVIINTCHIRERAAEKVYSELGRLRDLKEVRAQEGGQMILAVAGCVAQAEGKEILRRAPYVDMVFGPQTYHRLPEMVVRASRAAGAVLDIDFPAESKFDHLPSQAQQAGKSAFLTIQEGCDKFCTFCVVPYTRGSEFSRPTHEVLHEAEVLVQQGVSEITLLGQNVNCYHGAASDGSEWGLGRLIEAVASISGIDRIRYITSYPAYVDDALIAAHRDVPELMPYLHLPVQSGSDRILQAMNRQHGSEDYRLLVMKLREARPDIALSSDFIVGFPGETEIDFDETLRLVEDIGYAQAYSFKYSPRPGTPAALLETQVDEDVKVERLARLQDVLNRQQQLFNESFVGQTLPVLLDRIGREPGQLVGRSPYMQAVHINGSESLLGKIVNLTVTAGFKNSLAAESAANQIDELVSERVRA
ncbi:MAG: tRNA (N6-isopentenyl adenosine(37)-C2)-methylthiotransferase MiaB [Rhodospirillales bacterium]